MLYKLVAPLIIVPPSFLFLFNTMASFKYAQNINHGRTGSSPSSNSAKENSLPGTKLETNETGQASSIEQHKKRTSPGKALFMLLKAFVGTGVTFLPGA